MKHVENVLIYKLSIARNITFKQCDKNSTSKYVNIVTNILTMFFVNSNSWLVYRVNLLRKSRLTPSQLSLRPPSYIHPSPPTNLQPPPTVPTIIGTVVSYASQTSTHSNTLSFTGSVRLSTPLRLLFLKIVVYTYNIRTTIFSRNIRFGPFFRCY